VSTALLRYSLEQPFDENGMAMFFIAQDAAIEQVLYTLDDPPSTADERDSRCPRVRAPCTPWAEPHPRLPLRRIPAALHYEDPLYEITCVWGGLLALNCDAQLQADPKSFAAHYAALMHNGFDAWPAERLPRFLDIDLHDPALVTRAVAVLGGRLSRLQDACDAGAQP
jgi:hypothetical protein